MKEAAMSDTKLDYSRKEILIAFLALLIAVISPFASDSYTPSMPAMVTFFATSQSVMQLTITFFLLGSAMAQLIYGPMSDRFGRKRIVINGLLLCLLGSVLCIFSPSPSWLIAARFIQGAGAGAGNALFRAIMRDTFQGARMAQMGSFTSAVFTLSLAIAPVIGGYLQAYFGWQANFVFLLLLTLVVLVIVWFFLPETNQHFDPTATQWHVTLRNYRILLSSKTFVGYTLCTSMAFSGYIVYYPITPFLLQNVVGVSAIEYGWVSMFLACSLILGYFINGLSVKRVGIHKMISVGIAFMIIGGLLMLMFGLNGLLNVSVIVFPILIFCVASGLVFANSMAGAFNSFSHIAGAAGAMYGCLQIFGSFVASLFVAGIRQDNQIIMAVIFTLLGIGTAISYFGFARKEKTIF